MSDEQAVAQVEETKEVAVTKPKKVKETGNLFVDVAAQVENLTKTKALNLAEELATNIEANAFRLGGVLRVIYTNGWFEGYESFDVFVYERFGFQSRKAKYLMHIYDNLVSKQIPWEAVAHLGWTKIKDLAQHLTQENLQEWIEKAEKLTVAELQAALKAAATGEVETEEAAKTKDQITVLKFKVHQDQLETITNALNKAKGELGTEYDTVALENICMGYLGGSVSAAPNLQAMLKAAGYEAVLNAFGEVFPEINISVEV